MLMMRRAHQHHIISVVCRCQKIGNVDTHVWSFHPWYYVGSNGRCLYWWYSTVQMTLVSTPFTVLVWCFCWWYNIQRLTLVSGSCTHDMMIWQWHWFDSELEESLLVMPFDFATDLLKVLDVLVRQKRCVELVTKCLLFLIRWELGLSKWYCGTMTMWRRWDTNRSSPKRTRLSCRLLQFYGSVHCGKLFTFR